jgi:hypothetical protein
MVKCREAIKRLGDDVDGELPFVQRLRLTLHAWLCRNCRNYFRSYRVTIRAEQAALGDADAEVPQTLSRELSPLYDQRKTPKRVMTGRPIEPTDFQSPYRFGDFE